MKKPMKTIRGEIDVLGTKYTIIEATEKLDPKLDGLCGYCDDSAKICVVKELPPKSERDNTFKEDLNYCQKQTLRHEITHAFLFESGLAQCCGWAVNEEAVDWIARQFPKMVEAFKDVNAL